MPSLSTSPSDPSDRRDANGTANTGASVDLREVVVVLGAFPALSGLTLRVDPGELVALRGPNGAGKTTLLRVCAGLLAVQRGQAFVLGADVSRERRRVRCSVAYFGHAGFLYDDLSVAENVQFAVRAHGGEMASVPGVLTRLGLDGRLRDLPVSSCSAGQRRRTSLAIVVARKPRLWLLDEPHANLDAETRDLLDELALEAVRGGATVLIASHDDERAAAVAQRHVTITGGHVTDDDRRAVAHVA